MKLILLSLLIFSTVACTNPLSSPTETALATSNEIAAQRFQVDFLERDIFIPEGYRRLSILELEDSLIVINDDPIRIASIQESLARMRAMPNEFIIVADPTNVENCWWIQAGKYVDLNKQVASQYLALLKANTEQAWANADFSYELIEKGFLRTKTAEIIKIKYRQDYLDISRYQTQYLISSRRKTFAINITSYDEWDGVELIQRL